MTQEQDFHARAVELVSRSCDSPSPNKRNPVDLKKVAALQVISPHCEGYIIHGIVDGQEIMLIKSFDDEEQFSYVEVGGHLIENQQEAQGWWSRYGNLAVEIHTAEEQLRNAASDGFGLES